MSLHTIVCYTNFHWRYWTLSYKSLIYIGYWIHNQCRKTNTLSDLSYPSMFTLTEELPDNGSRRPSGVTWKVWCLPSYYSQTYMSLPRWQAVYLMKYSNSTRKPQSVIVTHTIKSYEISSIMTKAAPSKVYAYKTVILKWLKMNNCY